MNKTAFILKRFFLPVFFITGILLFCSCHHVAIPPGYKKVEKVVTLQITFTKNATEAQKAQALALGDKFIIDYLDSLGITILSLKLDNKMIENLNPAGDQTNATQAVDTAASFGAPSPNQPNESGATITGLASGRTDKEGGSTITPTKPKPNADSLTKAAGVSGIKVGDN